MGEPAGWIRRKAPAAAVIREPRGGHERDQGMPGTVWAAWGVSKCPIHTHTQTYTQRDIYSHIHK